MPAAARAWRPNWRRGELLGQRLDDRDPANRRRRYVRRWWRRLHALLQEGGQRPADPDSTSTLQYVAGGPAAAVRWHSVADCTHLCQLLFDLFVENSEIMEIAPEN